MNEQSKRLQSNLVLFIFFVVLTLSVAGIICMQRNELAMFLISVLALLVLAPLFFTGELFHPFVIFAATEFLVVLNFGDKYMSGSSLRYVPLIPHMVQIWAMETALLIIIVWYLNLYLGYFLNRNFWPKFSEFFTRARYFAYPKVWAFILLLISSGAILYSLQMTGGIQGMIASMVDRRDVYAGLGYLRQLAMLSSMAAIFVLYAGHRRASFFIIIVGTAAVALFGGRSAAVLGTTLPYLISYHYLYRKFKLWKLMPVIVLSLVFVVLWGDLRQNGTLQPETYLNEMYSLPLAVAEDNSMADILPSLVASFDYKYVSYQMGRPLLNIFAAPVPRIWWGGKPDIIDDSGIVGYILMGPDYWGLPAGPYGWAFFNFGWPGVIISGFLTGTIVSWFYKAVLPGLQSKNIIAVLLYAFLINDLNNVFATSAQINLIWYACIIFGIFFISGLVTKYEVVRE